MNPNPLQTLLLIWVAGGVLTRDGDNLHVEASKGAIPPQLIAAMRVNKTELLAILSTRNAAPREQESTR